MNKFMKLAPAAIIIAALALVLMLGRNFLDSKLPTLSGSYYKDFKTEAELEMKFSQKGEFSVDDRTVETDDEVIGNISVWYPEGEEGEKFPVILVANASANPASVYKPFFERLASWGFVVVGNEESQTGKGEGISKTLDVLFGLVYTHPLREVMDYDNIGIIGFSQGGAGALAAVTEYDNGDKIKAIYTGSAVCPEVAEEYGWKYDTSKISVPWFMAAGTGDSDAGNEKDKVVGVSPYVFLMDSYDSMAESVPKVRARIVGAEHGDVLKRSDGYMTAWMLYQLKGDKEAAGVFEGKDAEILNNANWQDVEKNL